MFGAGCLIQENMKASAGARKATQRILVVQLVVTSLAVLIAAFLGGSEKAVSAGVGGGIGIVVTVYFALQVFSVRPGRTAAKMAQALYLGEAVKLVLTVLLFAVALVLFDLEFLPLILTYAATLAAYWLALL